MITTLILQQLVASRQTMMAQLRRQEVLNVAQMAVQTHQKHLTLNGISVEIVEGESSLTVYEKGKEVLHVATLPD